MDRLYERELRADRVRGTTIPVLMYHQVSPSPSPAFRRYTVTAREFSLQMGWLATLGYQTIDMDALAQARSGGGSLPKRPVVITFDDGYQGCVDYAVPILRTHGFTAIFFLVAGLMGETSRWMLSELGVEFSLMSWPTARALLAEGFQCGGHTLTHPRLAGLDATRCRAELADSRSLLEKELHHSVTHLAYPYGSYDPAAQEIAAEAGYVTACSTRPGLSAPDDDLLALRRVSIYGHDSLLDFAWRLQTGCAAREHLAQAYDQVTQRLWPGSRA